jgi:hypothetical protein
MIDIKLVDARKPLRDLTYDPERAILPALIYAKRTLGGGQYIRVIALGWWCWGIRLRYINCYGKEEK